MLSAVRVALPRPSSVSIGSASARFPWLLIAASVVFATAWTGLVLTHNNLEVQSIDLCHHAMFVDHLQTPFGSVNPDFVGQYPLLSHRLAAAWMPLFHNPIQSIRTAALASLLIMYLAQWRLLRTQLSASGAIVALVAWQSLCTTCKLGNVNHFLWDFQYNYSRAVSAAALWTMLLAFAVPPSRYRILNLAINVGLAAFAFRCHIAAGSLALATCGVWCIANLFKRDWLFGLGGLVALMATSAALLLFTDEWRYLAGLSQDNGPMPIRHETLISLWIPTAVVGLALALWKVRTLELTIDLTTAILCGLLPAAVLQGYMLYGKEVTHTIGSYPYNQMLFYTFALSTLLWFAAFMMLPRFWFGPQVQWLVAAFAMGWGAWTVLETDARRTHVEPNPVSVIRELRTHRAEFAGCYYYDPDHEHASYFVTRCVLTSECPNAARYRLHCHLRKPQDLFREPELTGLFLPASLDIDAILGTKCPRSRVGSFWKCDLEAYRKSPAFERFLAGG